ncbi:septum formation initiator family protein [Streptomyces sp. NPDC005925]|uniref:septum formation initiator family protein n=1 Tax=Streptomyces sp. NPDC005925 TaxID=3157172 RepID=UPI0033DB0102
MRGKPELKGRAARLARLFPTGPGGRGTQAARTPFVLLVVVLLGGGLIALLVLNSALSAGSFRLDDLERQTTDLTDEEQALQRDVDAYSAPDALQRRARDLGMVPGSDPAFLGPDGRVKGVPGPAAVPQTDGSERLVLPPDGTSADGPPATTPTTGAAADTATTVPPEGAPGRASADPADDSMSSPTPTATTSTPGR